MKKRFLSLTLILLGTNASAENFAPQLNKRETLNFGKCSLHRLDIRQNGQIYRLAQRRSLHRHGRRLQKPLARAMAGQRQSCPDRNRTQRWKNAAAEFCLPSGEHQQQNRETQRILDGMGRTPPQHRHLYHPISCFGRWPFRCLTTNKIADLTQNQI